VVRGPSIESLKKYLKLKKQDATMLKSYISGVDRRAPGIHPDTALNFANKVMNGYGVEAVRDENIWVDNYWHNTGLLYVNMGDTYKTTLCYDTDKGTFFIGSWGDWAEKNIL